MLLSLPVNTDQTTQVDLSTSKFRRSRIAIMKVKQEQAKIKASQQLISLRACRYLRGPIDNA